MEMPGIGPLLLALAVFLIVYRYFPKIKLPFGKKRYVGGWSMYEKWRDQQQWKRYADKIHDILFEDFHKGVIDKEEYLRWMKRFSFMPDFKPHPMFSAKEEIQRRREYRYVLADGRVVSLYDNLDTVHKKFYPDFTTNATPKEQDNAHQHGMLQGA